ncbi:type II toxin-antitoxin system VapC family toxin [Bounagaea algeriensis]
MSLAVIDASVLTAFYAADDPRRDAVAARLATGDALVAPAHVDAEVVSALRRTARRSPVLHAAVPAALQHLAEFPIRRMPLAPAAAAHLGAPRQHHVLRRCVRRTGRTPRRRADHRRRQARRSQRGSLQRRPHHLTPRPVAVPLRTRTRMPDLTPWVVAANAEGLEVFGVSRHDDHLCRLCDGGDEDAVQRCVLGNRKVARIRAAGRSNGSTWSANAGKTRSSSHRRRTPPCAASVRSLATTPRSISAIVVAVTNWSVAGIDATQASTDGLRPRTAQLAFRRLPFQAVEAHGFAPAVRDDSPARLQLFRVQRQFVTARFKERLVISPVAFRPYGQLRQDARLSSSTIKTPAGRSPRIS